MLSIWLYSLISVFIVSLISLIGVATLSIKTEKLEKFLIYMISFSAGALLGDAFIHLLPESFEKSGFVLSISLFTLSGIGFSLATEKIIQWRHCHHPTTRSHPHPLTTMNLIGDSVHNFIDGIIIAASYFISIPVGMATTLAVIFHEIPQEISEFGVLLYGGYTKSKAILANFLIALTAVLGAALTLIIGTQSQSILTFLIPFAAGNFIYIACSDLIPELHKESENISKSIIQIFLFILGIAVMALLLMLE
ncbi:ZIP family metal transporter [Candidatus Pacearchaeota archaeon]|nr:ZIP family metal transporter [Candidatus Pacearchaeota archaeon]